jgi:hypothetical protein
LEPHRGISNALRREAAGGAEARQIGGSGFFAGRSETKKKFRVLRESACAEWRFAVHSTPLAHPGLLEQDESPAKVTAETGGKSVKKSASAQFGRRVL